MRISEFAKRAGVSTKTLRYYESVGVLPEPPRSDGGYRLYDEMALARLAFVQNAQRLGLSLAEVRQIAKLREAGTEPCAHVVRILEIQLRRAERATAELAQFRRELRRLHAYAKRRSRADAVVCRILEHASLPDNRTLVPLLRRERPV